jgi:hypothetical protein
MELLDRETGTDGLRFVHARELRHGMELASDMALSCKDDT